jgi:hypothetical protein
VARRLTKPSYKYLNSEYCSTSRSKQSWFGRAVKIVNLPCLPGKFLNDGDVMAVMPHALA